MSTHKFKLSSIIIFLVCLVVLFSLLITDLLITNTISNNIKNNLEEKAKIISRTVAQSSIVKNGLEDEVQAGAIQDYTIDIQKAADVLFIVVMDMNGIRKSHPNPDMIGKSFVGGDEKAALEGKEHISISKGTLGESLRAFTPIYNDNNKQIGAAAVGISLENVQQALNNSHKNILIGSVIGILVGIIGAVLLARYIKKILFGLEPFAIAKILEERSTMLQSVHEGIVAVDKDSTITLVNKSALRIFKKAGLSENPIGVKINDYMPSSRLDHVLETGKAQQNEELNMNGVSILVNRVPLIVNDQVIGAISTFRDKTEINQLAEQLTGVRMYADALRAQSHEFMNRLHVILGMVRMGYYDELADFIRKIVDHQHHEVGTVTKNVKDPALAGFIIGKMSYAREEQVNMTVVNEKVIPEPENKETTHELITTLGNLIDNAIESLSECTQKNLEIKLIYLEERLIIIVTDSGQGISEELLQQIFEKGFSTKGPNRGYGLYLVKQSITKLNGNLNVISNEDNGTKFIVEIPYNVRREDDD
ncbi:DcuS/MalK family sensor histidine kinase [Bacillus taeanensis]|uniref:histidine kinase n=1 Tax=Bacillus taeanensis TaxID=273032 RepID=A0A366Y439_9BACI|nr:DcuS/MalK family sensor histidine kinase [Bacillus taeanensis]RBW71154.1 two-component system sensor histidine kinase DcuS [Bacillus taeanensis]